MSLEILNQMIRDSARVNLTTTYQKASVILQEPMQPDSLVEIHGVPSDAIVIKVDSFPDPGAFFTGSRGECRRADYVIVSDEKSKKRVLFIEMKRTKAQKNDLIEQLKGATCVIAYCKEVAKQFYDSKNFLSEFEYRYVSLSKTSIRKTGTRSISRQPSRHESPERVLKISHPNYIQYNHLVGA